MCVKFKVMTINAALVSWISIAGEVCRKLIYLPEYKNASRISIYLSMPQAEISTRFIVLDALQQGKKVFVPYTYAKPTPPANEPRSVMNMVSLHSREDYESFSPDAWGIPTPSKASIQERETCLVDDEIKSGTDVRAKTANEGLHMVVMPGMAFDRRLARLGHGKGYYDFFLHRLHQQGAETKMPFLGKSILSRPYLQTPSDSLTLSWPRS